MARLPPPVVLCLILGLGLPACSSDEAAATRTGPGPARTAGGTSDPGSRYLDVGGPVGGLAAETPPVVGHYVAVPEPADRALPTPPPPPPPTVTPHRPVTRP